MPWVKGQSGNPKGGSKKTANRLLTNALKHALECHKEGDARKFDQLISTIIAVALDKDHKDFYSCMNLIFTRLQAPLRHELDEDEREQLGGLFELLQLVNERRGQPPDGMDEAAE